MNFSFLKEFPDLTFAYVKYVIILDWKIVVSFMFNHEYSRVKHLVAFRSKLSKVSSDGQKSKDPQNYQVQVHSKNLAL